ncbi:metal ABC transporter substrate-binding protein [Paenibacillus gansuensis]|uniref:Metal ABC transporter solute-binding protein, Zn/Mn family n=1 Tax=Paenibacillus gansuensis TaxID=306542 RepID=A0ABW5P9C7_9BACL
MRRFRNRGLGIGISAVILALLLTACGQDSAAENKAAEGKVKVITTIYPLADFVRNIGGDHVYVSNLVPAGVEPHDWSPKSRDMKNIEEGRLFIYNGAGFEGWVSDFLHNIPADSKLKTLEASKGIKLISTAEHTEEEHTDEHAEEEHGVENEHDHLANDPHTWTSPASALIMAQNIMNALVQADPANETDYKANYEAYKAKLAALDAKFRTDLGKAAKKDIVVSHQAFGYLARDYGLNQVSIMGLSPDAEPRGQDLLEIATFVKEHKVRYIFFEELVSDRLAKTLAAEAGVETLVLNPVEGITEEQEKKGEDYISLMNGNLQNLLKALQ